MLAALDVLRDARDRPMRQPPQRARLLGAVAGRPSGRGVRLVAGAIARSAARRVRGRIGEPPATTSDDAPQAMQEARRPLDALIAPVEVALGWRREDTEEARRVGAVALDEIVGLDRVALRLAHLGAVLDHHPLREQVHERLVERRPDG